MKNELVNFVNYICSYWTCLVTKMRKCAEIAKNFNLHYITNTLPSYDVHNVHQFTGSKNEKKDGIAADSLKRHVFLPVLYELYELLITHMMARRFFAQPATGGFSGSVNFCELAPF